MKEKRKTYEEKLDAQLDELNVRISLLKAEAKSEFYKTIEALRRKQDDVRAKLHELKTASDEEWEGYKTNTEKALEVFRTAFHGGAEMFK